MKISNKLKVLLFAYEKGFRISKEGNIINPNLVEIKGTIFNNYKLFSVRISDKIKNVFVHQLQAYQKYGNEIFDDKIFVRHKNGNSIDNSWDNILIGTQLDNSLDIPIEKRIINTQNSTKVKQKYSNELIIFIRHKFVNGTKQIELSKMFNIPKSGIHHILNNLYLFERINSDNILNKKPNLNDFKNLELDEILPENINEHLNKNYSNNIYSKKFCDEIKELSISFSNKEISNKLNISVGMVQYLINR